MFESLSLAFGAVASAGLGAVWVALAIFLFPVVWNAVLCGAIGLSDNVKLRFPEGSIWDPAWLANPWVAIYTIGSVGSILAYFANLVR